MDFRHISRMDFRHIPFLFCAGISSYFLHIHGCLYLARGANLRDSLGSLRVVDPLGADPQKQGLA